MSLNKNSDIRSTDIWYVNMFENAKVYKFAFFKEYLMIVDMKIY